MKKFTISEDEKKSILKQHLNEGHSISENMMGVAFGPEMNGLKVKKEETTEGLSDVVSGLKGAWRGEGYDYFKYLNQLKNSMSNLQRLDKPNHKIMKELNSLKSKISVFKMPTEKKDNLTRAIDGALAHFNSYVNLVQQISNIAGQKLS